MPFNGSGTFVPIAPPNYPAVAGQPIYASQFIANMTDLFTGFGNCVTRDGQSPFSANIPAGGFKVTGLGDGALTGQALIYGQSTAALLGGLLKIGGGVTAQVSPFMVNRLAATATGIQLTQDTVGTWTFGMAASSSAFTLDDGTTRLSVLAGTGHIAPGANNAQTMGTAALRWSVVNGVLANFSGIGTFTGIAAGGAITGATTINAAGLITGVGVAVGGPLTGATTGAFSGAVTAPNINFGGTTLANYLEGTFVPAVTGIGAPAYVTQTGEYQRVGNKIKFRLTVTWTAGTNAAGITGITGLPTASTAAIHNVTIMLNLNNSGFVYANVPVAWLNGSATIQVGVMATAATVASLVNPNAGTKEIYIAGEYFV